MFRFVFLFGKYEESHESAIRQKQKGRCKQGLLTVLEDFGENLSVIQ